MELREPLKTGVMLANEYRIDQVLGAGGFGITYLAEDVRLKMAVAIKEYFPADFALRDATHSVRARSGELGETFRWGLDSFMREAQMLARFDHPAITRVLRIVEGNGTAYMILRYEEGLPLKQHIDNLGRPMTEAEVRRMIYPVLDALEIVHAKSVLHRDISPDNLIVRPDGRGVLIDFGAARTAIADKSQALTGIVREGYSPPEQFGGGGRQGPWTDIYALGAVLYHAVTGTKPATSVHRILEDQMVPAATAAAGRYGENMLQAIDKAMRLKQIERPQTLGDFRRLFSGVSGPSASPTVPSETGNPLPGVVAGQPPLAPRQPPGLVAAVEPLPGLQVPGQASPAKPMQVGPALQQPLANPTLPPQPRQQPASTWMPLRKLLFSFRGRINRAKLWLGFLMAFLVLVAGILGVVGLSTLAGEISKPDPGPVTTISILVVLLLIFWMWSAIYVKRAHDRGWSGWFTLVLLVPVIGWWPLIEFLFLPGDTGQNRFGPDPLGAEGPATGTEPARP